MNKLNLNILHWVKCKGLSEDDQKEELFKRIKNIENKIKDENKKELESTENEGQSEVLKDE